MVQFIWVMTASKKHEGPRTEKGEKRKEGRLVEKYPSLPFVRWAVWNPIWVV